MENLKRYKLVNTYGVPQCEPQSGFETLYFDEFYELEEYLDNNSRIKDDLAEGYSILTEEETNNV